MAFVAIIALLTAAGPIPSAGDELARAETLCEQFKYAEARPVLAKARATPGLSREKLLRVLELQGVTAGQLRQSAAAVAAFKELLVLAPDTVLKADYAPRVTTPFLEAKGWVGAGSAPVASERVSKQTVTGLVVVSADKLSLSRTVRFTVAGKATTVALVEGRALFELPGLSSVSWSAEVLGAHDEVLFEVPVREWHVPAVQVAAQGITPPPPPPPSAEVDRHEPGGPGLGGVRVGSLVVGGVALIAVGVGAALGAQSEAAFSRITSAQAQQGVITGLTQQQAYALNAQGRSLATGANALFIGAIALVATAGILWLVGTPATKVTLVPTGSGVALVGVWR
jgi:hypothetical protein